MTPVANISYEIRQLSASSKKCLFSFGASLCQVGSFSRLVNLTTSCLNSTQIVSIGGASILFTTSNLALQWLDS